MMLLKSGLDRVCSVARSWTMRLNIGKCVVMRFSTCNTGNNLSCGYSIDGKVLNFVTSHRDLGVLVDYKFCFHDHIQCSKESRGLASELLRSTICRTSIFMVTLYVLHIRPIIEFCLNVGFWVTLDC